LGKFPAKSEAEKLARLLVDKKIIKNYFIIALDIPAPAPETGK